jgi:hypothetical protein
MTTSQNAELDWKVTPVARMALRDDGVILVEITPGCEQTPEAAQDNLTAAIQLAAGVRRPLLLDLRGAVPLDPATRQVYTDKKIAISFLALGIVVHMDRLSRLMADVYLTVAKLPLPTKIFSSETKASAWLNQIPRR